MSQFVSVTVNWVTRHRKPWFKSQLGPPTVGTAGYSLALCNTHDFKKYTTTFRQYSMEANYIKDPVSQDWCVDPFIYYLLLKALGSRSSSKSRQDGCPTLNPYSDPDKKIWIGILIKIPSPRALSSTYCSSSLLSLIFCKIETTL